MIREPSDKAPVHPPATASFTELLCQPLWIEAGTSAMSRRSHPLYAQIVAMLMKTDTPVMPSDMSAKVRWLAAANFAEAICELFDKQTKTKWSTLALPSVAPEFYAKRVNPREDARAFLNRVYGKWLDGTLTLAYLRRLDPDAAEGIKNWESRHPGEKIDELPRREKRKPSSIRRRRPK